MQRLASSRVPDPQQAPVVKWGVLGLGRIASQFVGSFLEHSRQRLVAVGSRDEQRSARFRDGFEPAAHAYGSYEGVLNDPDVDVVYVAVPHPGHADLALKAIDAGKHVLVEKPFGLTAAEGAQVVEAARAAGVFVAEAMWPRFLPAYDVLRQLLADGVLGEVHHLTADLGEYFERGPNARLFDPALGGGARLDLGVYLVALASFVGGPAASVTAQGTWTDTGVDAGFTALLRSERGVDSTLFCTLEMPTASKAWIGGTLATVTLDGPFYNPPRIVVEDVKRTWRVEQDCSGVEAGLAYEAAHVATCIADGLTESPLMPLDETLTVARTLDAVRDRLESR